MGAFHKIVKKTWLFYFILALSLFLPQSLWAVQNDEVFKSENGKTFKAIKKLGNGFFGQVWIIEEQDSKERYAVKFFDPERFDSSKLRTYEVVAKAQDQGKLDKLLRVYKPEKFEKGSKGQPSQSVVRMELSKNNLESYQKTDFQLSPQQENTEAMIRIRNAHNVMNDVLAGIKQLQSAKIHHHDLNPRNLLFTGKDFKIGDLDELTQHGKKPRDQAFELYVSPLDYTEDPKFSFDDRNLSDVHQLANTLHKLLFGKYPLQVLAEYTQDPDDIEKARAELFIPEKLAVLDSLAPLFTAEELSLNFPNFDQLNAQDKKTASEVMAFINAARIQDREKRAEALARLPWMKDFQFSPTTPLFEYLPNPLKFKTIGEAQYFNGLAHSQRQVEDNIDRHKDLVHTPGDLIRLLSPNNRNQESLFFRQARKKKFEEFYDWFISLKPDRQDLEDFLKNSPNFNVAMKILPQLLKESKSAEDTVSLVENLNKRISDEKHREILESIVSKHMADFAKLNPSSHQWTRMKNSCKRVDTLVEAIIEQSSKARNPYELAEAIEFEFKNFPEDLREMLATRIVEPALESGRIIHSVGDALVSRSTAPQVSTALVAIKEGLKFAKTPGEMAQLLNVETNYFPYVQSLRKITATAIPKFLELKPSTLDIINLNPHFISSADAEKIRAYLENNRDTLSKERSWNTAIRLKGFSSFCTEAFQKVNN